MISKEMTFLGTSQGVKKSNNKPYKLVHFYVSADRSGCLGFEPITFFIEEADVFDVFVKSSPLSKFKVDYVYANGFNIYISGKKV